MRTLLDVASKFLQSYFTSSAPDGIEPSTIDDLKTCQIIFNNSEQYFIKFSMLSLYTHKFMNGSTSRKNMDKSGFHNGGPKTAGPASGITLQSEQYIFIMRLACPGHIPLFKAKGLRPTDHR